MSAPTSNPVLKQAFDLAASHRLKVITRYNTAGDVIHWRVYRVMPARLIYLGSRVSPSALLRFVRELADIGEVSVP